jgi:hypothetical protein
MVILSTMRICMVKSKRKREGELLRLMVLKKALLMMAVQKDALMAEQLKVEAQKLMELLKMVELLKVA